MGLLIQAALPPASVAREVVGVGLAVGDGGSPSMIVTFGQAFRAGDVPAGAGMSLRLADGRDLPVQLDVTTRHPDGSAKFATVTAQLPALAEGEMRGMLQLAAPAAAPALDLAGLLAQHSAVIRIDPQDGGPAWSADLSALLSDALRRGAASVWSNGPLVAQARISLDVPEAVVGGAASMRVVTDLTVRADGTLAADVWLRNDVAMQAGGGTARYGVTVTLDGVEALRADHVKQAQYQAWGRLLDTSGGGAPTVRQDAKYLADAGAVARYDTAAGVDEGLLGSYGAAVVDAGWNTLLGSRGIAQYMPQTGGRADIGPATQAQAAWLISGDARAAAYAVGQAEASGSVPWNLWDEAAPSAGGAGTWLSLRDWPELWIDQRGGPSPGGLTQPIPGNTGWTPDTAHQPDLAFTPYLLTGRRALLDQVEAQAAWNLVADWPLLRDGKGIVANSLQVRGSAWALRQVDEAAWAAPDGSVEANYFRSMSEANWSWLRSKLPEWTAQQGEAHGWIPVSYDFGGDLRPWQQDYFATTAAAAARHGNADALAVLEWQANFLVGRFTHAAQGFDPHDGAAYLIWVGAGAETNTTWAEIGADTLALGLSNQGGWDKSQGDYPQLALESLALVADMLHSDTARSAYAWLKGAGAPFTTTRDYARDPIFNITYDATPTLPKNTNPVLLWQNTDGTPVGWNLDGWTVRSGAQLGQNPGPEWKLICSADLNGDGTGDLIWQHNDGTPVGWLTSALTTTGSSVLWGNPGPSWRIVGAADVNEDGKSDLIWQNSDGTPVVWYMDGLTVTGASVLTLNPGNDWRLVGTGDLDGDGRPDLIWQNSDGTPVGWLMNGATATGASVLGANFGLSWKLIDTGDLNGDGKFDLIWQNSDGTPVGWLMDGLNIVSTSVLFTNPGAEWHLLGTKDLDGDGKADLLWQNTDGTPVGWLMDGLRVASTGVLNTNPGSDWHLLAPRSTVTSQVADRFGAETLNAAGLMQSTSDPVDRLNLGGWDP